MNRKTYIRLLLALFALLSACDHESGNTAAAGGELGDARIALTSTLGGRNYRLTNAEFAYTGTEEGTITAPPAEAYVEQRLPAGSYTLELQAGWVLERETQSGYEAVDATLESANPVNFDVEVSETTEVEFKFRVASGVVQLRFGTLRIGTSLAASVGPISAGGAHTCVLLEGGEARCWGAEINAYGQLGGSDLNTNIPGLSNISQIMAGGRHTCVIINGGEVRCWGFDEFGVVGPTNINTSVPGITNAIQVVGNTIDTCVLTADGRVRCWGYSDWGALSDGNWWAPMSWLTNVTQIDASYHVCALKDDGTVPCWGRPYEGQTDSSAITNATQISLGTSHSCALIDDGTVRCWGLDNVDQLGGSTTTSSISGLSGVVQISAGGSHTCALLEDGTVRCWGDDSVGQLAGSSPTTSILGLSDVASIDAGGAHTCAFLNDGTVRCWGADSDGQLGGSSPTTPVQL